MEYNIQRLIDKSEKYYLAEGYHTVEHRNSAMQNGEVIMEAVAECGGSFAPSAVRLALAWHDAAIAFQPKLMTQRTPFPPQERLTFTAEGLAARLFWEESSDAGLSVSQRRDVTEAILATHPEGLLKSTESKIVAAADLLDAGLRPFSEFIKNTQLLAEEQAWKTGTDVEWAGFVRGSIGYLAQFFKRRIELTPGFYDEYGRSKWHTGLLANIISLAEQGLDVRRIDYHARQDGGDSLRIVEGDDTSVEFMLPIRKDTEHPSVPQNSIDYLWGSGVSIHDRKLFEPYLRDLMV